MLQAFTADEARLLTDRIKERVVEAWELLVEAHKRQAHLALGYQTWEEYVKVEFEMSKQRSYQLLDQAHVIKALEEASQPGLTPAITERLARKIKPHLDAVVDSVREKGKTPDEAVREVVGEDHVVPPRRGVGISRQARAIYDLKVGQVIVLPHGAYPCTPKEKSHHCGVGTLVYRHRKTTDLQYLTGHTAGGDFVIGCYDPSRLEDLSY
jgi:Zn-dependent M32 family carboxypeptidase